MSSSGGRGVVAADGGGGGWVAWWMRLAVQAVQAPTAHKHPKPHHSTLLPTLTGELEALQECTIGLGAGDQKEMLTRMLSKIAALETAVASAEARRREIHNQLVELKGNVSICCVFDGEGLLGGRVGGNLFQGGDGDGGHGGRRRPALQTGGLLSPEPFKLELRSPHLPPTPTSPQTDPRVLPHPAQPPDSGAVPA